MSFPDSESSPGQDHKQELAFQGIDLLTSQLYWQDAARLFFGEELFNQYMLVRGPQTASSDAISED